MQNSYSYYDDLRKEDPENFTPIFNQSSYVGRNLHRYQKKKQNIDKTETSNNEDAGAPAIVLCHVPVFVRFTKDGKDYSAAGYGSAAASIMAAQHWNTGNGAIVKEIEGINNTCPIRFTTEIFDTQSNAVPAVKGLTDMMIRKPGSPAEPQPCAIVGTIYSSVSTKFAITSGVYDLLQVAPGASSDMLDDRKQYPLFSRTHPADGGSAFYLPKYLKEVMEVKNFAIVYIADDGFGLSYLKVVSEYARINGMNTISVPISFNNDPSKKEIMEDLRILLESDLNYVIAVFFFDNFKPIMEAAGELGVAGPGKFWFFAGSLSDYLYEYPQQFEKGSLLYKATYGSAIITDGGAAPGTNPYNVFLKEWKELGNNPQALEYINNKQPSIPFPNTHNLTNFSRSEQFFNRTPNHIAIYSYEAMIGIGLAACEAAQRANSSFINGNVFSGQEHHRYFLNVDFGSASGRVVIGPNSYSRNETSTYFVVANILESNDLEGNNVDPASSKVWLQGRDHVFYDPSDSKWKPFSNTRPFVYSDGTNISPFEIPQIDEDLNLISSAVRASCLVLSCIVSAISLGLLVYTVKERRNRVIRLAQPPFLILICVGTMFMAISIIPLSIDDGISFTNQSILDASCSMTPWFFSVGFTITFAALFSKLWRINQVLNVNHSSFRRVAIKVTDVLKPFAVLSLCNMVILSVWQFGGDRPEWVRVVTERNRFDQVVSSSGACSNHGTSSIPYLISLIVVNGIALLLACYQAYIGRSVQTELNESKFIGMAMICICECCFFALPLLFISGSNRSGMLFVFTSIAFVICISTLSFIFVPKIYKKHVSDNRSSELTFDSGRSRGSNPPRRGAGQLSDRGLGRSIVSGVSNRCLELRASQRRENIRLVEVTPHRGSLRVSNKSSISADRRKNAFLMHEQRNSDRSLTNFRYSERSLGNFHNSERSLVNFLPNFEEVIDDDGKLESDRDQSKAGMGRSNLLNTCGAAEFNDEENSENISSSSIVKETNNPLLSHVSERSENEQTSRISNNHSSEIL